VLERPEVERTMMIMKGRPVGSLGMWQGV